MRTATSWMFAALIVPLTTTACGHAPVDGASGVPAQRTVPADLAGDDLKAFPPAPAGLRRWVIRLPAVPVPEERRVEVIVGRTIEVDCNRHSFAATVTAQTVPGWGFVYYVVGPLTGPIATRMACPPDFVKRREFVRAHTDALAALPYNPKLPIVVYAPDPAEVRYRVWSAGSTTLMTQPE